ncbi:MAG: riboflavin synthase [Candidatus Omnitrophica bacterium]|nr:riboflavin synthase [Candidatus Omnitrophota bacterium]
MFTGIVETLGTVLERRQGGLVISPKRPLKGIAEGESVSVDGVCLTVEAKRAGGIAFQLLPETERVSTLGVLRRGDLVNLERSLRVGDRVGGHLLLGHVDGKGVILRWEKRGNGLTLTLKVPRGLARFLIPKGPIGVDGVSLTLDPELQGERARVHLVPHTVRQTVLGRKRSGSTVNLEVDLVAKYLWGVV